MIERNPLTERAYKPLPLETFLLDQAVLEVRYDNAYLFWDRSGQIWRDISKAESGLRPLETEPNRTVFAINQEFQLSINTDRSRLSAYFPERNLDLFMEKCNTFFQIVLQSLDMNDLNRIGLRLIYSREYPRLDDAAKAVVDLNLASLPHDRHFGIAITTPRLEYIVRSEDEELGFLLKVRTETQVTEINPGLGTRDLKFEKFVRHRVLYDVDHYTTTPLRRGQFRPGDWIKDRLHATNRDSSAFLGG